MSVRPKVWLRILKVVSQSFTIFRQLDLLIYWLSNLLNGWCIHFQLMLRPGGRGLIFSCSLPAESEVVDRQSIGVTCRIICQVSRDCHTLPIIHLSIRWALPFHTPALTHLRLFTSNHALCFPDFPELNHCSWPCLFVAWMDYLRGK